MRSLRRLAPAALLATTVVLGACGDDPLSPDSVDPVVLSGTLSDAAATLQNNVAFQSLTALSYQFPVFIQANAIRSSVSAIRSGNGEGFAAAFAERAASVRTHAGLTYTLDPLALFPSDVLGKTLEWDEATDLYVIGNRTGAPGTGVRILLYAINPLTEMPIEPVQELGSLDLTDESSPAADKLGIVLRLGNTAIADYDITVVNGLSTYTRTAVGFVRRADGTHQLNFNLQDSYTPATPLQILHYQFRGPEGMALDIDLTATLNQGLYVLRVAGGGNTIEITVTETPNTNTLTGLIKFNGTPVANISGTPGVPIITGADGRVIPPEHLQALFTILDQIGTFADEFTGAIFRPGETVF